MKNNAFLGALKISCYFFTAVLLCIYLALALFGIDKGWGIFPLMAFSLYAFCLFESLAGVLVFKYAKNGFVRYITHLALTVLLSALMFSLVNGLDGVTVLSAEIVIAILHSIVFAVISTVAKKKSKPDTYENVYSKSRKK